MTAIFLMDPYSPYWCPVRDGDLRARFLFDRHYSRQRYRDRRRPAKIIGPGQYLLLATPRWDALFAWRKFIDPSGQLGVNCNIFRNESPILSSLLIPDACRLAWLKWPGQRLYTYVNPRKIASSNPGYCFLQAGWHRLPTRTKSGLRILELLPHLEPQS